MAVQYSKMNNQNQIEIYQASDGSTQINVQFEQDTVWLNRNQLASLFDRDVKTIGKHINNVFKEGELNKEVVVAKFAITTQHGAVEGKTQTKKRITQAWMTIKNSLIKC